MSKPITYTDDRGNVIVRTGTEPLPIFYEWRAELPAGPWQKKARWRKLPQKMTWEEAKAYAVQHGLSFQTQMQHDESTFEMREDVYGGGACPPGRGGTD